MPPPPAVAAEINPPEELTTQAISGFFTGAARFGSISLLAHIALQRLYPHPIYRSLTPQFKLFIQLSAMMLGGCIWAEKRVVEFNELTRKRRRALDRSERAWRAREVEESWLVRQRVREMEDENQQKREREMREEGEGR